MLVRLRGVYIVILMHARRWDKTLYQVSERVFGARGSLRRVPQVPLARQGSSLADKAESP
jgi:hypothetical protein